MADSIKETLTRKVGPLPAWAWVSLGAGLYLLYRWRHGSTQQTAAQSLGLPLGDNLGSLGTGGGNAVTGDTTTQPPQVIPYQPPPVPPVIQQAAGDAGQLLTGGGGTPLAGGPYYLPGFGGTIFAQPGSPYYQQVGGSVQSYLNSLPNNVRMQLAQGGGPITVGSVYQSPAASVTPSQNQINWFNSPATQGFLQSQGYNGATLTQQQAQNLFNLLGQGPR